MESNPASDSFFLTANEIESADMITKTVKIMIAVSFATSFFAVLIIALTLLYDGNISTTRKRFSESVGHKLLARKMNLLIWQSMR
jgi:hypothetical protein